MFKIGDIVTVTVRDSQYYGLPFEVVMGRNYTVVKPLHTRKCWKESGIEDQHHNRIFSTKCLAPYVEPHKPKRGDTKFRVVQPGYATTVTIPAATVKLGAAAIAKYLKLGRVAKNKGSIIEGKNYSILNIGDI